MPAGLKYGLGRVGLFLVCAIPAVLLLPDSLDLLLKLLLALVVSAVLSFVLLRGLRDQVGQHMTANRQRKDDERNRLRSALQGDDEPGASDETRRD